MSKGKKYHVPVVGTYRALVDLSFRADEGGWLDVKAGEEFMPPKKANIQQCIERGYIEAAKSGVTDND